MLAVSICDAPVGGQALIVGEILRLRAKTIFDNPSAIPLRQVVFAVAKVGARVSVVVAHDSYAVIDGFGVVRIVGPISIEVGFLAWDWNLGICTGYRVVSVQGYRYSPAGVKFAFNGCNSAHVGARAYAIFHNARFGQDIAISKLVERLLPETLVYTPVSVSLLGILGFRALCIVCARIACLDVGEAEILPGLKFVFGGVCECHGASSSGYQLANVIAAHNPGNNIVRILILCVRLGYRADACRKCA